VRRLYIFTALGVGLLATALISIAVISPETLNNILDPDRIEVVNVRWGKQISEVEIWINFTVFNHGEDKIELDVPSFALATYEGDDYNVIDKRKWHLLHGENEILMIGRTIFSKYRLMIEDNILWEGII